jgi:hypothetical protein
MRSHTMLGYPFSLTVELDGGPLDISDLLREPSPAAPGSASIRCLDLHEARRTIRFEERARELAQKRRSNSDSVLSAYDSIDKAAQHLVAAERTVGDSERYWIENYKGRWLVMRGDRP